MIRATATTDGIPSVTPLDMERLAAALEKGLTLNEDAEKETLQKGTYFGLKSLLSWIWHSRIPNTLSPRSIAAQMRCTPRSFSLQMDEIAKKQRDPKVMLAYLTKAVNSLPLEQLLTTPYCWTNENIEHIFTLLSNQPERLRKLFEVTSPSTYIVYPGLCKTKEHVIMMLDVAYADGDKLREITNIVLTMLGDARNGPELDHLYYFYLSSLIQRQGSDAYIAERLQIHWKEIPQEHFSALQKIENAPQVQKFIAENLPRT